MTRNLALLLAVATSGLIVWSSLLESSDAATARKYNLQVVKKHEDAFRNYDFTEKTVSRKKVDWVVNFVWYNRAEIDKVKDDMHGFLPYRGGTMYARLDNGSGPEWDEDKGKKSVWCPNPVSPNGYHTRLYAPTSTDRMYNRTWGYYIIGTSHIDHNECIPPIAWFGKSEKAEGEIALMARDVYGPSRVKRNHRYLGNSEPYRREGKHIWDNDAYATFVKVP